MLTSLRNNNWTPRFPSECLTPSSEGMGGRFSETGFVDIWEHSKYLCTEQ